MRVRHSKQSRRCAWLLWAAVTMTAAPTMAQGVEDASAKERAALERLERTSAPIYLAQQERMVGRRWPWQSLLSVVRPDPKHLPWLNEVTGQREAQPKPVEGAAKLDLIHVRRALAQSKFLGKPYPIDEPSVRAFVDFYLREGKPSVNIWMRRMALYAPMIKETLASEGLPPELIYMVMIESGFLPQALSPKLAHGQWQLLKETAKLHGLRIDAHRDERRDPVRATRAAARYLKQLKEQFGSWPLAIAAYNAGPGRIESAIDAKNTNDAWLLIAQRALYEETRQYVPKIYAVALLCEHPQLFGLEGIVQPEPLAFETVELGEAMLLSTIAKTIDGSVEELKLLNPELERPATPKGYTLRVPKGQAQALLARLHQLSPDQPSSMGTHVVRFGERVEDLAAHYGISAAVLRSVNGLEPWQRLKRAQRLIIPLHLKGTWKPTRQRTRAQITALSFNYKARVRRFYRVQAEDSLALISEGFQISLGDLLMWNDLDPQSRLKEGMIIQLYLSASETPLSLALLDEREVEPLQRNVSRAALPDQPVYGRASFVHTVKDGESLWSIAHKHGLSLEQLLRYNPHLKVDATLRPAQELSLRPPQEQ